MVSEIAHVGGLETILQLENQINLPKKSKDEVLYEDWMRN